MLNGLFGVEKDSTTSSGATVLRLIMNLTATNSLSQACCGDVGSLPYYAQWRSIVLHEDEELEWARDHVPENLRTPDKIGEATHKMVPYTSFNSSGVQCGILVEGEGGGADKEEEAEADADSDEGAGSKPHEDDPAKGEDTCKEKSEEDDPPILSKVDQKLLSITTQVNHLHQVFDSLFEITFIQVLFT